MEVILQKDVKGQGKKDDVIQVANGYGQFLIKSGSAIEATGGNISKVEERKEVEKAKDEEQRIQSELIKKELEAKPFEFQVQVGKGGNVFGSVSSKQIIKRLSDEGFAIDKKALQLKHPITTLGTTKVELKLHKKVTATLKIVLSE